MTILLQRHPHLLNVHHGHAGFIPPGPCGFQGAIYRQSYTMNSTMENHRQWRITCKDIEEFLET